MLVLFALAYNDPRDATSYYHSGASILVQAGYTDQPYCATLPQQQIACVVTVSDGNEGSHGEHVVSIVSADNGRTWEPPVRIEPGAPGTAAYRPNSYANIVYAPALHRLYATYNLNLRNVSAPGGKRNDELGLFFSRYSEDGGRSWSADRYEVPYPDTWIDRHNSFVDDPLRNGTRMMWTVDQVKVRGTHRDSFPRTRRPLPASITQPREGERHAS